MGQIPLALQLHPFASFETFVTGANLAAVEHLHAVAVGERRENIWLFGGGGSGKSHLLAAACRAADAAGSRAMYLAVDAATEPGILQALDGIDLLAIDDLQEAAGDDAWEAALFSLFNARLEVGRLLVAARHAPRDCGFGLADLESRASAAALYRLSPPDDDALMQAVLVQANERGLALDRAAAQYLVTRVSRDMHEVVAWLDRIDRYSLVEKRRVTVPLLRQVLESEAAG